MLSPGKRSQHDTYLVFIIRYGQAWIGLLSSFDKVAHLW